MRRVQRKLLPISRHRRIEDEINLRRARRRVLLLKLCNLRRVSVSGGFFFLREWGTDRREDLEEDAG